MPFYSLRVNFDRIWQMNTRCNLDESERSWTSFVRIIVTHKYMYYTIENSVM